MLCTGFLLNGDGVVTVLTSVVRTCDYGNKIVKNLRVICPCYMCSSGRSKRKMKDP